MGMMWSAQINMVNVVAEFISATWAGMLDEIGIWNLVYKIATSPWILTTS